MDVIDPTRSVAVFGRGPDPDQAIATDVRTQDPDAIRQAWQEAVAQHGLGAEQVTEIFAEWQPSPADESFIRETFGDIKKSFVFQRPVENGWEAAFAAARETLAAVAREHQVEQTSRAINGLIESTKNGVVLPVLRSTSLASNDVVKHSTRYLQINSYFFVTLAAMAVTPSGRIGMRQLMNHEFADDDDFAAQLSAAIASLRQGLVLKDLDAHSGQMARVHRNEALQGAPSCYRISIAGSASTPAGRNSLSRSFVPMNFWLHPRARHRPTNYTATSCVPRHAAANFYPPCCASAPQG